MIEQSTATAKLMGLQIAPRKVSLVAGLVRGRTVDDAIVILQHTNKRAAKPLAKLLASVRANAVHNENMKSTDIRITTLSVTAGARIKRFRPVSRGQAHPYQKRTSNILVVVSGQLQPTKKVKATTITKATESKDNSDKESN